MSYDDLKLLWYICIENIYDNIIRWLMNVLKKIICSVDIL